MATLGELAKLVRPNVPKSDPASRQSPRLAYSVLELTPRRSLCKSFEYSCWEIFWESEPPPTGDARTTAAA